MSKVFSFNEKLDGSYIDGTGNYVLTNLNGKFSRLDKGFFWDVITGDVAKISLSSTITLSRNNSAIEIWFRLNDASGSNMLAGYDQSAYSFFRMSGYDFNFESDTNSDFWTFTNTNPVKSKEYYHIVLVADGGTVNSYLNGELIDTTTPSDDITIDRIGAASTIYLNGSIGRIQIWDNAITEKERAKLYQEFLQASPTSKIIR